MATRVEEAANTIAATGVDRYGTHAHQGPATHDATGHHSALAHHFDNMEQQRDATSIGMWVFLVTEIMFFGALFFAYTLYRAKNPEAFAASSYQLNVVLGGINTAVLIGSSLTMAMAVYFSQIGARKLLFWSLILTMILGTAFLGIKSVEYKQKFEHNTFPGRAFQVDHEKLKYFEERNAEHKGADAEHGSATEADRTAATTAGQESLHSFDEGRMQMFFVIYYAMTGIHALHMIIGIVALGFLAVYSWRGAYSPEYHAPVELTGLYWHFVDIVWIFLFPLLYLIGRH